MDDADDLTAWAQHRDEAAFRRLVERHSGLVAAACRRQLSGDAVDEAAQAVFIVLAKRAADISDPGRLSSWLYGVALKICRRMREAHHLRTRHEQRAAMSSAVATPTAAEPSWNDLRPHLDAAIASLSATQREVVIGRFLAGQSHASVAQQLGISEDSARMRCSYAIEKLHGWFKKRGLTLGAGALAVGLASEATAAEPAMIGACTQAAVHPAAAAGASAIANSVVVVGAVKTVLLASALAVTVAGGTAVVASKIQKHHQVVTPASVPMSDDILMRVDFEDGALKPESIGTLASGPKRVGNRWCLQAQYSSQDRLTRVKIGNDADGIFSYRDGAELSFDYWVGPEVGNLSVYLWDRNQQASVGNHEIFAPELVAEHWAHATVQLSDLKADNLRLRDGDLVVDLTIQTGVGAGALYVDNVTVATPRAK